MVCQPGGQLRVVVRTLRRATGVLRVCERSRRSRSVSSKRRTDGLQCLMDCSVFFLLCRCWNGCGTQWMLHLLHQKGRAREGGGCRHRTPPLMARRHQRARRGGRPPPAPALRLQHPHPAINLAGCGDTELGGGTDAPARCVRSTARRVAVAASPPPPLPSAAVCAAAAASCGSAARTQCTQQAALPKYCWTSSPARYRRMSSLQCKPGAPMRLWE